MLQALLLAVLLAQDTKPAKTVEDRLKELDEKIATLEKRQRTLVDENAALEKKLADGKAWRGKVAVQTADYWMKRHATGLGLTEKQAADLHALWVAWTREGFEKRSDAATWKAREEALRGALTAEQIPLLEKAVRAELEMGARNTVASYGKQAVIAAERSDAFVRTVMNRLSFADAGLIPQARPAAAITGVRIVAAIEASVPDLASVLTPEEQGRLGKLLAPWAQFHPKED